ncbi:MAG: sigma-70 family RNA polymerase sigma factor [Actinobacteria bacterium]|nr:sigma-70 family RNA polymerase sigma factor [Actinomycetota bacterium]
MDERAAEIERVYHARYRGFTRAAAALLPDDDAAHDAVQDAFASAYARREQFRGGLLEAWIWKIVLRKVLDMHGSRRTHPYEETLDATLIQSGDDPELAEAIRALAPRRRLIVFLRYFADLRYGDIAQVCGLSEGTVAATLAQAHAELRRALELEGVER